MRINRSLVRSTAEGDTTSQQHNLPPITPDAVTSQSPQRNVPRAGVYQFPDLTLVGPCINGRLHGLGAQITADSLYLGFLERGARTGFGVLCAGSEGYLGHWRDDEKHGPGLQWAAELGVHFGIFWQGKPEGPGVLSTSQGTYVGRWRAGEVTSYHFLAPQVSPVDWARNRLLQLNELYSDVTFQNTIRATDAILVQTYGDELAEQIRDVRLPLLLPSLRKLMGKADSYECINRWSPTSLELATLGFDKTALQNIRELIEQSVD